MIKTMFGFTIGFLVGAVASYFLIDLFKEDKEKTKVETKQPIDKNHDKNLN